MPLFALATLLPLVLLAAAALWGGVFGWLALGSVTALVLGLDRLLAPRVGVARGGGRLPVLIGAGHFAVLALALRGVAGQGGLDPLDRVLVAVTAGLVAGQIAHPVAHELIHRAGRWPRRLGRLIYTSLLFGHHASAHPLVHHVHVATPADPSSARPGESFYRYVPRAWAGAFREGFAAENRRHRGALWRHPYALYLGGAAGILAAVGGWLGWPGLAAHVLIALHAQAQILLADYVQHYGLARARRPDGRPVPVGPAHAWNAPQRYSAAMTLNAPRHSDHHQSPARPYTALRIAPDTMPILPRSLPVCAMIALIPPLWRRMMDARAARWREISGAAPDDLAG